MAFSAGKYAWGICDISGQRYKLKDMKTGKEEYLSINSIIKKFTV